MDDPHIWLLVMVTFLLAGTVKGVIGLGLPTVSLGLLAIAIDVPTAMALMLVPSFITNVWQAAVGGHALTIIKRIWPFLGLAVIMVWVGALALTRVDLALLSALLGALVVVYAIVGLAGAKLVLSNRQEVWAGPFLGAVNGLLTGMTGSFVVPGVLYLQALGLPRDRLIQAMGILFTASTVALAVALGSNRLLSVPTAFASLAALVPALLGMALGQKLRGRLSEMQFRRFFFAGLLALGGYIIASVVPDLRVVFAGG